MDEELCEFCSGKVEHFGVCEKHLELGLLAGQLLNLGIIPTVDTVTKCVNFLVEKEFAFHLEVEELPELMKEYRIITPVDWEKEK